MSCWIFCKINFCLTLKWVSQYIYIKEARKSQPKILGSATKVGKNTTSFFNCFHHDKYALYHIKPSTCRKICLLLINSIYLVFCCLEIQRRPNILQRKPNILQRSPEYIQADQVYYKFFDSVWKEMTHKHLKVLWKIFSPLCMLLVQLASINVYYSMW